MIEIKSYGRRVGDRTQFDCGNAEMNDWIRTKATNQEGTDNTRTFLAVDTATDLVLGYYASCSYQLGLDAAALAFGMGKKRYPVPALLLARLAVDRTCQGQGIGKALVVHALEAFAKISKLTGVEIVVVDAIDLNVVAFYAKLGFTRFDGHEMKLFIPTKTLRAAYFSE
jgi:ribosomal protein S18 acetylase RimI-like enzyme